MSCEKCQNFKQNPFVLIWRLAALSVPYLIVYTWLATQVNRLSVLFSGDAAGMTSADALSATPVMAPILGIKIPLPDPLAEAIIVCIVTGVILYVVLKYICSQEWVQEEVEIKECWEEIKWYNPWSWVKAIVCTIVEVLQWVLKTICKWTEVFVTALVVLCIIISIIVVLV